MVVASRSRSRPDRLVDEMYFLWLYALREYFRTRLEATNAPTGFIERMMGHKPYLDQSYLKPSEKELANRCRDGLSELALLVVGANRA